jgi:hypothetical protein
VDLNRNFPISWGLGAQVLLYTFVLLDTVARSQKGLYQPKMKKNCLIDIKITYIRFYNNFSAENIGIKLYYEKTISIKNMFLLLFFFIGHFQLLESKSSQSFPANNPLSYFTGHLASWQECY